MLKIRLLTKHVEYKELLQQTLSCNQPFQNTQKPLLILTGVFCFFRLERIFLLRKISLHHILITLKRSSYKHKKTTDFFNLWFSTLYRKRNYPKTSFTFLPISAGESTTKIPFSRMIRFLASAVSSAPPTIAPACPIVRPFGAVSPAMKPITGFLFPFSF